MNRKKIHRPGLGIILTLVLAGGCGTPAASPTSMPVTPTQVQPSPTVLPFTLTPVLPTPTPNPTPNLSARPLVWFGPLPPMETNAGRPFIGSPDFMELFTPEAPWQEAASHVQIFKLFGEWVSEDATMQELQQVFADLQRRGMAVDVDEGPLTAPSDCGGGVEGFAGISEGRRIAARVKAAGGTIDLIDMDEPFAFASLYDGPNACHWNAEKVAQAVYEYVKAMQKQFPDVIIGTSEPFWRGMKAEQVENYIEAYHTVSGSYFPFFHFDPDYSLPDWPQIAKRLESYCRARGIAFGIYYVGNWGDTTDQAWLAQAGERVKIYELQNGGQPDHVIFQSWNDHPDASLPESKPDTYTNFVNLYIKDKAALGVRTSGAGANLAYGKKVSVSHYGQGFEPALAVDGNPETWWGASDFAPQRIQLDLGTPASIAEFRLKISQSPSGQTYHRLLGKGPDTGGQFILLHEFKGYTADQDVLTYTPPAPLPNIQFVQVETLSSPSWVAWREIEVIAGE